MDKSPELWACILANTVLFLIASVLTALSYLAYRRSDGQSSYRFATIGFGFVVLGGLVEPVYLFGVRGNYNLQGTELLALQAGEGVLIALGLGLLFYAITCHDSRSSVADDATPTDEYVYGTDDLEYGN